MAFFLAPLVKSPGNIYKLTLKTGYLTEYHGVDESLHVGPALGAHVIFSVHAGVEATQEWVPLPSLHLNQLQSAGANDAFDWKKKYRYVNKIKYWCCFIQRDGAIQSEFKKFSTIAGILNATLPQFPNFVNMHLYLPTQKKHTDVY